MEENLDHLKLLLTTIESIIDVAVNPENGEAISMKLSELVALQSTSSYSVALAEKLYNVRMGRALASMGQMSATDKKLTLSGILADEQYWKTYSERLNAGLTHAIDGLRSMLSFIKEERKNSGYHTT